jgi:16S rRNA (adenine1518-N6/adenine1519-N6)-dimethyltransferase
MPRRTSPSSSPRARARRDRSARRSEPAGAGAALAVAGVRPSKSRGQNFLVQTAIADRIVETAALQRGDTVVEIGPGLGILSERIAAHPIARLLLVEVDQRLAARLGERFAGDRRVTIIHRDFLELDLAAMLAGSRFKVLGNLPFNVASAILRRLCDHAREIDRMVLMFQREVAERIRARPGDSAYAALSVFTALYFEVESHFRVSAGNFHPRPNVDAEVLAMVPRGAPAFARDEEAAVLETVRAAFSAPRKTLRNALSHALHQDPARIAQTLARAGVDPGSRAEEHAAHTFVRLARALRGDLDTTHQDA